MKQINILFILVVMSLAGFAQQLPHYTQYFFNSYAFNPAVGGTQNTVDVKSNHRYQWVGLTDAPRTYALTVQGPSKDLKNGFGAFLFTDHVGPTRRTGLQFSYSHIFNITKDVRLSMGLSGGILEWKLDGHKINLYSAGDQVLVNSVMKAIIPDATFGIHLFHEKWYFGASAPNLLQSKINFENTIGTGLSKLEDHYYINGGYKFNIGNDFQIEPGLLVKLALPAPVQLDVMARVIWRDQLWLGGVYRTQDAFSAMIGFTYGKNLSIGYSYDFTTSNLTNYSTGTHELMIGVKFSKAQSFN
jgi:type IX secretion system PorP/SprF family membrane protein